jgi:ATP-dependent Clp protease ATP-binding subunit ClpC
MSLSLTIPVYVDHQRDETDGHTRYRVRPLLVPEWTDYETDLREDRALNRMAQRLRRHLLPLYLRADQRALLPWTHTPELTGHHVRVRLVLKASSHDVGVFVAVFEHAGLRLAILPSTDGLCFEWKSGVRLESAVHAALEPHLKRLEKQADDEFDLRKLLSGSQPHFTHLTVNLTGKQRLPGAENNALALFQEGKLDGAQELHQVGRCLNRLYPNELKQAQLREDELQALQGWFGKTKSRKPMVLLVGRSKSGKTALIHELVKRTIESVDEDHDKGEFWLISPQRVISGMSFVGQWEQRWLAMLGEMRKRHHVLVLDDLTGLFYAGRSSGSDLNLGLVLKARQEHEPVSILAEATPEAWARLRETDRSFASLFQVVHLREMSGDDSLRILVRTLQSLETQTQVRMTPGVLPMIMRLQQRFGRANAFPGKAVEMMQSLAAAHTERFTRNADSPAITEGEARAWFAGRNGINLAMIDPSSELQAHKLRQFFGKRIMGQEAAVQAMMNAVLMARAEINDPQRPLSSMLFLGPTGVGKTECAKALAEFVFGTEERMLRFDLNEYSGPDALVRLIGGPGQSGLLTSKVRRQPFSLLLFDEVEKAYPDVFDLLLQVLGEGRLTDAVGQTADFCNCIIILTSNLGARSARRRLGFDDEDSQTTDEQVYREAAEKFFRPEFFNRIDCIVAFHELRKQDIERLAETLSQRALERQGVRDRKIFVHCEPSALTFLSQRGFDREYGARALRRAIETHLVEPLAEKMLTWEQQSAMKVKVSLAEDHALAFEPNYYRQAEQSVHLKAQLSRIELLDGIEACHVLLNEAEDRTDGWEMKEEDGLDELRTWYYLLREEIGALRHRLERLEDKLVAEDKARRIAAASRGTTKFTEPLSEHWKLLPDAALGTFLADVLKSDMSESAMERLLEQAVPMTKNTVSYYKTLWRTRWLLAVCAPEFKTLERVVVENEGYVCTSGAFVETTYNGNDHSVTLEGRGLCHLLKPALSRRAQVLLGQLLEWRIDKPNSALSSLYASPTRLDFRTGIVVSIHDRFFEEFLAVSLGNEPEKEDAV